MNLAGTRILVDGYNLELRQGTGIKSYGVTLLDALRELGAKPSVLVSCGTSRDPRLQETLLFDAKGGHRTTRMTMLADAMRLFLSTRKARTIATSGRVVGCDAQQAIWRRAERLYTLRNCFSAANFLMRRTGRPLTIRTPDKIDIWHATCPLPIRVRGARTVTTIHDLIPLRLPWATLDDKELFHRCVGDALRRSDLVVADSEHTRKDIVDIYGTPAERIQVVYAALPEQLPELPEEVQVKRLQALGLRPGEYMLHVSAIEPRKNIGRLLQAVKQLQCHVPLVLAGRMVWAEQDDLALLPELQAKGKVVHPGYLTRMDLQILYRHALFLVFPSLYEGFGLPPLEAMAQGCPVISSSASSLPEVCGEAALYVDPAEVDDIAAQMGHLLENAALRDELREKGKEQARLFSMDRFRARLSAAYATLS